MIRKEINRVNKKKWIELGYRILGIIGIIVGVTQICTQDYVHPTTLGIMDICISILFLLIQYNEIPTYNKKFEEIAKLQYNWNGNGAKPFDVEIINEAKKFIEQLNYPVEIFPTACESIQIEYNHDKEYIEFEVFKDHIEMYTEKSKTNI